MGAGAALKRGEVEEKSEKNKSKLIGVFARINYSFNDRYLASVSIRHEGATQFGANYKWGNFPAVSVGWNIHNEEFMSSLRFISSLKARLGFGVTGSIPEDPYMSLSRLTSDKNLYTGSGWLPSLKPSSNANPNLRWEKKEEWNLGVDFGVLDNRISGSIDLYKRTTKDMLWNYQVATPPYLYQEILANAGTMQNKGLEIHLSAIPVQTKEFSWTTSFNYSTNKNKLVALSNEEFQLKSGYIEDGSFLRMQTLTLGYTLPKKILDKIKFEKIRIYGQVANVFTITGYSGLDPQVRTDRDGGISNDRNMGTDFGAYGMPRQFIIGLNLTF